MKIRSFLAVGLSVILMQSGAFGAPRSSSKEKKPSQTRSAKGVTVKNDAAANFAPAKTNNQAPGVVVGEQPEAPAPTPGTEQKLDNSEDRRYEQVKARAKQDPEVKRLKEQSDAASTAEEARKASEAYNHSLFRKMRQLDSSLAQRTASVEAAIIRRINFNE